MSKGLMLILSWIMAAVATEGDSYRLSGSFNAEKFDTDAKKHRVLKQNITRREAFLMFDKVSSQDDGQYELDERFNKDHGDAYTRKDGAWIFRSNVLTSSRFENHTYIIYAITGETFLIRSWSLNDATLSLTIKEGDSVYLRGSFTAKKYEIFTDRKKRLELKYNITEREAFLMFSKVGNEDEGQYEMEESFNKSNADAFAKKDGAWIFHLNVLESDEIKRGNVGESIIILQLNKPTAVSPSLYHYDQLVTVLRNTDCDISSESQFYRRLRCEIDKVENRYRIEIQNVAQRDTGIYRINTNGHDIERCFLNITVKGTTVASRLNTVTIHDSSEGMYYSQLSTETLPPTVKSISSKNTSILWSVLIYIIPIVTGAVGLIMLMMCCLKLIQRKNTHSLETGKTGGFGNDAHEMVDTLYINDHVNAFQGVEIDTVSTNIPISTFQGTSCPRNDFIQGTKDDDGYETVENAINMRFLRMEMP